MPHKLNSGIAVIGIDIGKNSFHVAGHDKRGAIVLRQKWSRGQVETRLANLRPCLIGMEACVGAHHLRRKLQMLGHDARLMPAKYVRPYSKGQKNDFRDAEAIAEAVQRPTMKFVGVARILPYPLAWHLGVQRNGEHHRHKTQYGCPGCAGGSCRAAAARRSRITSTAARAADARGSPRLPHG
jgi:Transposase